MFWQRDRSLVNNKILLELKKETEDKIKVLEIKLDMLETNFRIFCTKFNKKLGKLPTEKKEEETKDIKAAMFLAE